MLRKMVKCEYQNCSEEAAFRFGLAAEGDNCRYYCEGHQEIVKREIISQFYESLFKRGRCIVIKPNGDQCLNGQKFGKYCGIHIRIGIKRRRENETL